MPSNLNLTENEQLLGIPAGNEQESFELQIGDLIQFLTGEMYLVLRQLTFKLNSNGYYHPLPDGLSNNVLDLENQALDWVVSSSEFRAVYREGKQILKPPFNRLLKATSRDCFCLQIRARLGIIFFQKR